MIWVANNVSLDTTSFNTAPNKLNTCINKKVSYSTNESIFSLSYSTNQSTFFTFSYTNGFYLEKKMSHGNEFEFITLVPIHEIL